MFDTSLASLRRSARVTRNTNINPVMITAWNETSKTVAVNIRGRSSMLMYRRNRTMLNAPTDRPKSIHRHAVASNMRLALRIVSTERQGEHRDRLVEGEPRSDPQCRPG